MDARWVVGSALVGGTLNAARRAWNVRSTALRGEQSGDWKKPARDAALKGFLIGAVVGGGVAAAGSHLHDRSMKATAEELLELQKSLGGRPDWVHISGLKGQKTVAVQAGIEGGAALSGKSVDTIFPDWDSTDKWVRESLLRYGSKSDPVTKLSQEQISELFRRYQRFM